MDANKYLPEDLNHAPIALKAFHDEYPDLPGLPKNLDYWLEYTSKET